jgi:hypothetical protein
MEPEVKRKFFTGLSKIACGLIRSGRATERNLLDKIRELLIERAPHVLKEFDRLRNELPRSIRPNAAKELPPPDSDATAVRLRKIGQPRDTD